MESVFYKHHYKKRFPITYQFLELFANSVDNNSEDAEVHEVLTPVLSALGHKPPYREEFILEVVEQLTYVQKAKSEVKAGKPASGRSFGTEFIQWFSKLDVSQIMFLLSDYDFEKAANIYNTTPVLVVDKMMELKMEHEWQIACKDFEAVIFGMGGKIKGGAGEDDKMHEAPKTEVEEKQRASSLKRLGF